MATKPKAARKPRTPKVFADEEALKTQIETLKKTSGDEPSEAQSKQLSALRSSLGSLRFVRLAKQRTIKVITSLRGVAKLGGTGYVRTPEQVAKLTEQISAEFNAAMAALKSTSGKAKEEIKIDL